MVSMDSLVGSSVSRTCGAGSVLDPADLSPDVVEAFVYSFVSAVYLLDIVDDAGAFGRHGGNQERNSSPDVWRDHRDAVQREFPVQSDDSGSVRIA